MLTPKHQTNLLKAKEYFEQHLAVGDYYSEQQVVRGEWLGAGARLLGLSGVVQKDEFVALCENRDPGTGGKLTPRTKTTRRVTLDGHETTEVANRRLFCDFTISPPKSVSIAALVSRDERIVEAHDRAVRLAVRELERFAATRVRRGGSNSDRATRNVIAAIFRHDTSRALDPQLHSHCIVFNATFDAEEGRWKALQAREMFYARKYVENAYYHELARDLRRFGYRIINKARGDFELEGIPPALLRTFSKRHCQIDEQTHELLAKSPELAVGNMAEVRGHLAQTQRPWKSSDVNRDRLQASWEEQLSTEDRQKLEALLQQIQEGKQRLAPAEGVPLESSVTWAEEHLFDRKSLVHEHELWRFALERGRGDSFTLDELHAATDAKDYLRDPDKPERLSTRDVLEREAALIRMAREGSNACPSLVPDWQGDARLDEAQAVAARQILSVRDFAILFRGGAGTGKSFTLRAIHDALKDAGHPVQVLAPQRQQVEGLTLDGMAGAQTLASFLTRGGMPPGGVFIVDEAGQIGAKNMLALLALVKERQGRVILSGDTRQHGAVQASDALWVLEKYGQLHMAELNEIRRQDPARGRDEEERRRIAEYKQAVEDASKGLIARSFDRLDEAGAIVECPAGEQHAMLTEQFLRLARAGRSTLVVSPTWGEIYRVNDAVRLGLQAQGLIGTQEWQVTAFQADDLTDAQKRDARYYDEGRVIVFNQTSRGVPKGAVGSLVAMTDESIIVEAAGRIHRIPVAHAHRLTVGKSQSLTLAKGDRLQLKANAKATAGERLSNGELVTVRQVDRKGRIHLEDGRVLPPQYRQFVRGYAVTSYASQGKTVDHVLFSDSGIKAATNDQQWYVTISRGRMGVKIFTTDKETLRENVTLSGKRALAMDIVADGARMVRIGNRTVPANSKEFLDWCRTANLRLDAAKQWQAKQVKPQTPSPYDSVRTVE